MKRGEGAGEYADGRGRPECGKPVHDAAAPEGSLETAVRARDVPPRARAGTWRPMRVGLAVRTWGGRTGSLVCRDGTVLGPAGARDRGICEQI